MVRIIPFKSFYPLSLTDFALPMIFSDIHISPDVKGLDENDILKIPANVKTSDYKRIFQEILTLGHSRKYEALSRHWPSYHALGFFGEAQKDDFYVYRMEYSINEVKYQQTGLLCCLELDRKSILGHENIFKEKLEDQMERLEKSRTSISPVFLMYDDTKNSGPDQISETLNKVTYSFPIIDLIATNDVRHTIWKLNNNTLSQELINLFKEKEKLYIADGHHRVESTFQVREKFKKNNSHHTGQELYNFILTAIFPVSQANILEYNRVVKNVKKFKKNILPKIQNNFIIEEIGYFDKPLPKGTFILYARSKWYKVNLKEKLAKKLKDDIVKQLDSYIIQEYLFKDVFEIKNPRNSRKIAYIPGSWSVYQLIDVAESEKGIALILPPISVSTILKIANAGKVVPPKTTWFEPKLLKGLMFWKF